MPSLWLRTGAALRPDHRHRHSQEHRGRRLRRGGAGEGLRTALLARGHCLAALKPPHEGHCLTSPPDEGQRPPCAAGAIRPSTDALSPPSRRCQVYIKQPAATVPVPNVRLAAFARVHVRKGGSATVTLVVKPDSHSVVTSDGGGEAIYFASADQQVEKGEIELHVGGGQPGFYAGAVTTKASVTATAALSSCTK